MKKLILVLAYLLLAVPCGARIITVDDNGTADFNNIQAAIDDAMDGDTVVVSNGTYEGDGNRNIQFWGKAITLKSESGPDNCIIDCGYCGGNWYTGITFSNGEDANSIIDGFTITGAYGSAGGAAIRCLGSSPIIRNCKLVHNTTWYDGIIGVYAGGNPTIINCLISNCISEGVFDKGGIIYCNDSAANIINCTIIDNQVQTQKNAGAIYCENSTVNLMNSIVWDNKPEVAYVKSGSMQSSYSCIQGGWPGEGNIDINPLLTADGHLQADSPCIDLSETGPLYDLDGEARPVGIAFDIGSDEFFDADSDSLPNCWEVKYFGSIVDADPNDDPDDDRMNNLKEYVLSTNPLGPYYVNGTNGDNQWDGCAPVWDGSHGPKSTIQAAINTAHNNDTIVVADGIYTGNGNRDIDFRGRAITVKSTNGPESCIIDCQATEGNEHRGFYFHTSEGPNSILNGLTITNGVAFYGGGIYCEGSSPTIKRCRIIGNYSRWRDGGGIFCDYSCPQILDSIIIENRADDDGGGIYCEDSSNAVVSNCVICDNTAGRDGGGVVSWYSSEVLLKDCIIAGNHAGRYGGGLEGFHDSPVLLNCLIVDNSADSSGGGLLVFDGPNLTIGNCTIANNIAAEGGGVYVEFYMSVRLRNSILYGNFPNQMSLVYHSTAIAEYTDVEGGWSGTGNIDLYPQFVDANHPNPNERDYHLLPGSPCINAGDPNYIPEPNETDLDGNPRINGGRIDMGAYESIMHEARLWLWPRVIKRKSRQPRIMAWLRLPQGITKDQIDKDEPLILYPGGIKAVRQFVIQNRRRGAKRTSIFAFFNKAELMDAIETNGRVQLMVLGHLLKPGRYFYGSDTIKIIAPQTPRRPPRRWPPRRPPHHRR